MKEEIVYDKHNCRIVGFVDLVEVNNTLLSLERSCNAESSLPVAKHILMFMVRGIFSICSVSYKRFGGRRSVPNCLGGYKKPRMCWIQVGLFNRRQSFSKLQHAQTSIWTILQSLQPLQPR